MLLVADSEGCVFGAYTDAEWIETNKYFGSDADCALFSLRPVARVFRRRQASAPVLYLNSRSKTIAHGLGIGGSLGSPRLWLNADLDVAESQAGSYDPSFDVGKLRSGMPAFKPVLVELWGIGDAAAVEKSARSKADNDRMLEGMRKVDRTKLVSDFDKEYLLGETFKARKEVQSRGGDRE